MNGQSKRRRYRVAATAVLAVALFLIPALWLDPAPMPALSGLAGGLLGWWLARRRRVILAAGGLLAGVLAGAGIHLWQHHAEGRVDGAGSVAGHVAADAGVGLTIAAAVLAGAIVIYRAGRARADSPTPPGR